MPRDISSLYNGAFDLLIIGGGINGAAIANLAAGMGKRIALIEKNDFGSGTSSKSTKLIHGGIRYLEHGEFDLVFESLRERSIQLKSAPHLVKPLEFLIPIYEDDARPGWMLKLGVFLYDFLSFNHKIRPHRSLKIDEVLQLEPGLKKAGLKGGVIYYDAQMDDARLVLENILCARTQGAIVANYVESTGFVKENGKATGVKARDTLSGQTFFIKAKKIVCAVGPWTNELLTLEHPQARPRVRTTKGVHIVYEGQISRRALLIPSRQDNRVFFIIPWMGHSLIGTTDTDFSASPDSVKPSSEDIEYLLGESSRVFPDVNFERAKIITTFAGLRPLVWEEGHPSAISRKHLIFESFGGIVYLAGGKYTTYRVMALETLEKIFKQPLSRKMDYPLYGSGPIKEQAAEVAHSYGLSPAVVQSLMDRYGIRYRNVLDFIQKDSHLKESICDCGMEIKAQIVYALNVEMAQKAEDIIWRRLSLGYRKCPTGQCRRVIEEFVKNRNETGVV